MAANAEGYALWLQGYAERDNAPNVPEAQQKLLRGALARGLDQLPLPGHGHTLARWQVLAEVAGLDLALLKLFEGHTDALAILAELDAAALAQGGLWAVWAAEPPQARATIQGRDGRHVRLAGRKAWCSGAGQVSHALLTAWDEQQRPQLVAVALAQPAVRATQQGWQAVGMAASASVEVLLDGAVGEVVGAPGEYLSRPGFWHGGGGIAACWYGAAVTAGHYLRQHCQQRPGEPHAAAHLGAVDADLAAARAVLHACAHWIDANPAADAQLPVQRARAVVEGVAERVLRAVGHALGATPFCREPRFARLLADLPVFLRQSHAERDLAGLAACLLAQPAQRWSL